MYEFVDIVDDSPTDLKLPSEALILHDGTSIEQIIDGYKTLSVSGRELFGQEIESLRRTSGGHGSIYLGASYPPREITINYQLDAPSAESFRSKFNRLNEVLSGDELEFGFNDEPDYSFKGALSQVGDVPSGSNSVRSSFTLFCSDPFKYKTIEQFEGKQVEIPVPSHSRSKYIVPTLPEYITVRPDVDITADQRLSVSIGGFGGRGKLVSIQGVHISAGSAVTFDFNDFEIYLGHGTDTKLLQYLTLNSDFETFKVREGDSIRMAPSGTIELGIRGVGM